MAQNTAGVALKYGVETTAGTKPTTFTALPNITDIPEINAVADVLDSSTLDNSKYKTSIEGLIDIGGALSFKAVDDSAFRTAYATMISAYEALSGGKAMWFRIEIPAPLSKGMDFTGVPSVLGFGGATVNSVLTTSFSIVATNEPAWVDIV